jgi:predicted dehydrogenase
MEFIRAGQLGNITQMRAYWHRNNDWRRTVPSPELEKKINWRLYKEFSCGLMTELASHQIQVANWALGEFPDKIMGAGSINYWKDGREVHDNVNLVYSYPGGTQLIYDSCTSNKHYGLEEQIMGPKGTMELEAGKMFSETPPPAPGILHLLNNIEHRVFDTIPLGGASWVPDTPSKNKGEYILDEDLEDDGTQLELEAFAYSVKKNKIDPEHIRQAYYASIAALLGFMAIEEEKVIVVPENLKIV